MREKEREEAPMLQNNFHHFFGTPFIYFGSNQNFDDEDLLRFSFQNDLILSNQEKIGLFIHWFDDIDENFDEDFS